MVQRCIDTRRLGSDARDHPAGTANLLASNLGIPKDIEKAVEIGLSGAHRRLDVGRMNGERFAVMAGAGFDARMIGDADGTLKDRFGRLAYIWTGAKHLRDKPFHAKIAVDGARWYDGDASCILFGNVGKLFGGVEAFEDARPDDGILELGVVSADGTRQWVQTIARAVVGSVSNATQAHTTKVHSVRIKLDKKVPYELDGGDRKKVRKLRVDIEPGRSRSACRCLRPGRSACAAGARSIPVVLAHGFRPVPRSPGGFHDASTCVGLPDQSSSSGPTERWAPARRIIWWCRPPTRVAMGRKRRWTPPAPECSLAPGADLYEPGGRGFEPRWSQLARRERAHLVEQARVRRCRAARRGRDAGAGEGVGEADVELRLGGVDDAERHGLLLVELAQRRDAALPEPTRMTSSPIRTRCSWRFGPSGVVEMTSTRPPSRPRPRGM